MGKARFPKRDRLTNCKDVKMLFEKGNILRLHLCTVFYLQLSKSSLPHNKVLFAVSKRSVPSAVRRNRIKRLLRESYRINRRTLDDTLAATETGFAFLIGYVYNGKEEKAHYATLNQSVAGSLRRFVALVSITRASSPSL